MKTPTATAAVSRRGPVPSVRRPWKNRRSLTDTAGIGDRKTRAIIYDRAAERVPLYGALAANDSSHRRSPPHLFPRPPLWVVDALGPAVQQREAIGRVTVVTAD